jgi:hypothetical protein
VRVGRRDRCDFYVFVIAETQDMFVVPSRDVPENRAQIAFCWPSLRPELAKWQKYHNRFDLITCFNKE